MLVLYRSNHFIRRVVKKLFYKIGFIQNKLGYRLFAKIGIYGLGDFLEFGFGFVTQTAFVFFIYINYFVAAGIAVRFYFIREYCYGSMFRYNRKGEFNIPYGGMTYNRKDLRTKVDEIFNPETETLFSKAEIYCEDFGDFFANIELNDNDFMFLDPPYDSDFSDYEGKEFTKEDQKRLAEALKETKAKFILVIKNTDYIISLYERDFNILCFDKTYSYNVRSRNERNVEHLIITNIPAKL